MTTALGGALEILDESCGLLVEPNDPSGLAVALEQLIESAEMRRRLGDAGAARALSLCDPAARMKALSDVSRCLDVRIGEK